MQCNSWRRRRRRRPWPLAESMSKLILSTHPRAVLGVVRLGEASQTGEHRNSRPSLEAALAYLRQPFPRPSLIRGTHEGRGQQAVVGGSFLSSILFNGAESSIRRRTRHITVKPRKRTPIIPVTLLPFFLPYLLTASAKHDRHSQQVLFPSQSATHPEIKK